MLATTKSLAKQIPLEEAQAIVTYIDENGDGEMSWEEVKNLIKAEAKAYCKEEHPGKENQAERKACKKRMKEEGKMMFDFCDSDMSG